MAVRATLVTVVWDVVPGATGYDVLRDGVKVSSTRTATTARLPVTARKVVWEVRSKGATSSQFCDVQQVFGVPV